MPDKLKIILLSVLGIFVVWILCNLLLDKGEPDLIFSADDLPPVTSMGADNAFYYYLALGEPEGVDLESENLRKIYSKLADSHASFDEQRAIFYRSKHNIWLTRKIKTREERLTSYNLYGVLSINLLKLLDHRKTVEESISRMEICIERLKKAMSKPLIEDFYAPIAIYSFDYISDTYTETIRFYCYKILLQGFDGNWKAAGHEYLDLLEFQYKFIRHSRISWLDNIFTFDLILSYWMQIYNNIELPPEIIERMDGFVTKIKNEGFSFNNFLVADSLARANYLKHEEKVSLLRGNVTTIFKMHFLLLQRNRTIEYLNDYYKKMYEYLSNDKYVFPTDLKIEKKSDGFLWWIFNPGGKLAYDEMTGIWNFPKYFEARARVDLLKLSLMSRKMNLKVEDVEPWLEKMKDEGFINKGKGGGAYKFDPEEEVIYCYFVKTEPENAKLVSCKAKIKIVK